MRFAFSIKTLLRAPVKTILTLLLLGIVSFTFISQTVEYVITNREMEDAAELYVGVGTVEISSAPDLYTGVAEYIDADPRVAQQYSEETQAYLMDELRYRPLTAELVDVITTLPYVSSVSTRYMTAGVSDIYYRPHDGGLFFNYTARCVVEATLREVRYGASDSFGGFTDDGDFYKYNEIILEECRLLGGATGSLHEYYPTLTVAAYPFLYDEKYGEIGLHAQIATITPYYENDSAYLESLITGGRYVFVLRYDSLNDQKTGADRQASTFMLSEFLSAPWCETIWPVEDTSAEYLSTDEFAPLRKLIEITNSDAHTFDVVYTDDMGAIMRFAEGKMAVVDGRALTREDNEAGRNICVVSREFAAENGLAVGDTVTLMLGTELFEQYKSLGAVAGTLSRYKPAEIPAALEIVGIYTDVDAAIPQSATPNRSYSVSTFFVPKSLLQASEDALAGHVFSPSEVSFTMANAWDIPAFLEESAPIISDLGLHLVFYDGGWTDIADAYQTAGRLSRMRIPALALALIAANVFVVYLFVGRKKKEYAITRALGAPRRSAAKVLFLPLVVINAASALAGGVAAWVYAIPSFMALKAISSSDVFSAFAGDSAHRPVPVGVVLGCVSGEILLALIITLILLRRIGKQSPLSLLHDGK